jgi:ATP-dependent RNA helicase HelY
MNGPKDGDGSAGTDERPTARFAATLGFTLDDFQRKAIEHLLAGQDVLVAAPTGAGKTVVGEFACAHALETGGVTFYTTPIKALSNQKYRDLCARHGEDRVGLLTGDRSINGRAPIVVMTTEILRNMIYEADAVLDRLRYVVLDEVHYLADRARGAVWEEVIVQLPAHVRLIALSATVSNAEDFGAWLALVRGGCALVLEERRPVPLRHHYFVNDRLHDTFRSSRSGSSARQRDLASQALGGVPNPEVLMLEQRARRRVVDRRGRRVRDGVRLRWPSREEVAAELARRGWLPAIVFVFSRQGCDDAVAQLRQSGIRLTSAEERVLISEAVDERLWELPLEDLEVLGLSRWRRSLLDGVAAHHAGLVPLFKEIIESLFQQGLLKLVFATETLALGINMPARSVVIERLEKYDGEGHVLLTPGQYTQLTGRAGRRGIDDIGHAVVLHQRSVEFRQVAGLVGTRSYPLHSSFRPSYNMVVNLLRRHDIERAERVLRASFAQFETDADVARDARRLAELESAMTEAPSTPECENGDWGEYWSIRRELTEHERASGRSGRDGVRPGGRGGARGCHRGRGRSTTDRARIDGLRAALGAHACHDCSERHIHEAQQRSIDREHAESDRLRRSIEQRTGSLVRRFHLLAEVLRRRGYLERDSDRVTDDGRILAGVYADVDLLVAELVARGSLDGYGPADLAGIAALLVHEPRRDDVLPPDRLPTSALDTAAAEIQLLATELRAVEAEVGITPMRDLDAGFVEPVVRWATGATLEEAVGERDISGGDFVRNVKQVIDLLGQLRDGSAGARRDAFDAARRSLQRGIVDA